MQHFLFRRVELWVVCLLSIALVLCGIALSVVLKDEVEARATPYARPTYGRLGSTLYQVASIPDTLRQLTRDTEPLEASQYARFNGRKGWGFTGTPPVDPGYLLLSRIDGDLPGAVVELVALSDFTTRQRWELDPDALFADLGPDASLSDQPQLARARFRPMHPLLTAGGQLVLHGQTSPIVALDACGGMQWRTDKLAYHHSLNLDADGNFWAPAKMRSDKDKTNGDGTHDALAKIGPDGGLLWSKTIADLLVENDMTYLIYHAYEKTADPLHLNDIQPVLTDGPYWQKGDLFISLRTPSMILLYRPSTGKILWSKAGPWIEQHDVDVLDDHRISVFDNNVQDRGAGGVIDGSSQVRIYDFATGQVTTPLAEASLKERILAVNNGLMDQTASGLSVIEEDTSGRLLIFGTDGGLAAEFINGAANGRVYRMGWSRYVEKATGDAALGVLAATSCKAAG